MGIALSARKPTSKPDEKSSIDNVILSAAANFPIDDDKSAEKDSLRENEKKISDDSNQKVSFDVHKQLEFVSFQNYSL